MTTATKHKTADRLTAEERHELPDSAFGIPETREFPLVDAEHVRLQRDYDKAFNQLSDGNGSVVRQAEMLKGMSLTPKKRISPRFLPKDTIQEETEEENDNIQ